MTDWRTGLRDLSARDDRDELSSDEAEAMRRAVLAAAATKVQEREHWSWMRPAIVAATVVLVIAVGVIASRRGDSFLPLQNSATTDGELSNASPADHSLPNRQLQFLAPGGTRIIWVFNSDFDLKATTR